MNLLYFFFFVTFTSLFFFSLCLSLSLSIYLFFSSSSVSCDMFCDDGSQLGWSFTVTDLLARKRRNFPSSFATALASRSREALLHISRNPTVTKLLTERPGILSELEAPAKQLRSLEDLVLLLRELNTSPVGDRLRFLNGASPTLVEVFGEENVKDPQAIAEGELIAWLQLSVWVRYCTVIVMQRLVALHECIFAYAQYWVWAEKHSARASFHLSLSGWQWLRQQCYGILYTGWGRYMLQIALMANTHGAFLHRMMRSVVCGIGTLHNILDRANSSIATVGNDDSWFPVLTDAQHEEARQRVLSRVRTAVTRAVWQLKGSLHVLVPPEDVSGGSARDPQSFPEGGATSLHEVLNLFYVTAYSLQLNVSKLEEGADKGHMPPRGRRWRPVAFFIFVVIPSVAWLAAGGARKLLQVCSSARTTLRWMVSNYVVWPLQEVRRSLLGSRPGVLERRRALEEEMKSVANIISDYCKDCSPDMSDANRLEQLHRDTLQSLRMGVMTDDEGYLTINRDFESAIKRPIRSVLFGNLPRLILVQLACKQLEVNRVINVTGEILEENDLNFRVMAMIPVITFLGGILQLSLQNRRVKRRPVILHLKLCWWAVHHLVTFPEMGETSGANCEHPHHNHRDHYVKDVQLKLPEFRSDESPVSTNLEEVSLVNPSRYYHSTYLSDYDQGMLLLLTHHMRRIAMEYYPRCHHLKQYLEDLDRLESVWSTRQQRLSTLDRMWHAFHFLSQHALAG
ncbi:hypothetical protein, conserved [Trypanosoma brucei gambiense DAL972]|uniref:ATP synthase regulation protein NCA2 n=1 Tax=Trypanosoma brucei gambiense (strain MHOM/CI/86/DAL972) TaxID=679716 RepID=D0A677_TRYB9|nr:hypothetical protein, conserved [Trypanosoma brucei gambiense DAL972]CBH17178.1 hypothetical protein, conserved [Trypanosoma brucei gambiense DAL972]|eukprot:XP_011779442.1 hypothetical protein, conserved [Trypanosoma brucei gambiense DAL972]